MHSLQLFAIEKLNKTKHNNKTERADEREKSETLKIVWLVHVAQTQMRIEE